MAKRKSQKSFTYHGCGFPVILHNVPMVFVRGVWTPDINYNELHRAILVAMANSSGRLTGSEIRFARHYFELTLVQFGEYFDVSHPAVLNWERAGDGTPSIKWSLERDIRLFILDHLDEGPEAVGKLYAKLRKPARPTPQRLRVPVPA